jgi:hypothetical protein
MRSPTVEKRLIINLFSLTCATTSCSETVSIIPCREGCTARYSVRLHDLVQGQIKWPAYTAVMAASGGVVTYTLSEAVGSRWLEWAGFVIFIVALVGFPISLGIAIVRYRLYEIDTLINRTLVYGIHLIRATRAPCRHWPRLRRTLNRRST